MEKVILRLFAAVIVILAITGCTVRCEVEPIFYDTINKLLLSDDNAPVMSKAKKGKKS